MIEYDKSMIDRMPEEQLKRELLTAVTIIRKTVSDVPESKRKQAVAYTKQGHMRCVNYLKGFLNVWERKNGN